jgi:hypothetical protein
MSKSHRKELFYYGSIVAVSVAFSILIMQVITLSKFQSLGSRVTGEDAIWILKNSNIILTPDTKIEGESTPLREYINNNLE